MEPEEGGIDIESDGNALEPTTPLSQSDDIELDIRESIEEVKARNGEGEKEYENEEQEDEEQEGQEEQKLLKPDTQPKEEKPKAEYIDPPHTWRAEDKEAFKKWPVEAQKEFRRRHDEMERQFHRINTDWRKVKTEYEDIDRAVSGFEKSWAAVGITRGEGIQRLARAQMMLDANPAQAITQIARSYGLQVQIAGQNGGNGHVSPQIDPTVQALREELNSIKQTFTTREQQAQRQANEAKLSEFHGVRDETDEFGRYLYPELHDDQFVENLAPLYAAFEKTNPDLSPAELLKRAYSAQTGKNPQARRQQIEHSRKARTASLSARAAPVGARPAAVEDDDDPNESVEATIQRTIRSLERR